MKRVFLLSCGRKKKDRRAQAGEMYTSPRFSKARELIAATECPWFILSAKHGLLSPDEMIEPYDMSLNNMPREECQLWAEKVKQQMDTHLPDADKVVILAGKRYFEYLLPYLEKRFAAVDIPMKGLGQGEQLRWLNNVTEI